MHLPDSSNILNSNYDASISAVNTFFTFKAVIQFKHAFVSRLNPSHSCDDIVSYIRNSHSVDALSLIKCYNFKNERNTYFSFKISVPTDIFDSINKPNFRPSFVKEFTYNRNTTETRIPNRRFLKTHKFVPLLPKCKGLKI